MASYCTVNELEEFLTLTEGSITAATFPDTTLFTRHITLASSEIWMALQASDQATCTKADEAEDFLTLLAMIGAALLTEFDNARFWTDETKRRYQEWKDSNLELIRTGKLALCQGHTGLEYPAFAVAEQAWTDEAAWRIWVNYQMRNSE